MVGLSRNKVRCSAQEYALAQKFGFRSSVHRRFELLDAVDGAFDRGAPDEHQSDLRLGAQRRSEGIQIGGRNQWRVERVMLEEFLSQENRRTRQQLDQLPDDPPTE